MKIKEIENAFWALKGKHLSGKLDDATYKQALKDLKFKDEGGNWWRPDPVEGHWTTFDGDEWIKGTPPSITTPDPVESLSESQQLETSNQVTVDNDRAGSREDVATEEVLDDEGILINEVTDFDEPEVDEDFYGAFKKEMQDVNLPDGFEKQFAKNKRIFFNVNDLNTYHLSEEGIDAYFKELETDYNIEQMDAVKAQPASGQIPVNVSGNKPSIPQGAAIHKLLAASQTAMNTVRKVKESQTKRSETQSLSTEQVEKTGQPSKQFCTSCGAKLGENKKFCTKCGKKV